MKERKDWRGIQGDSTEIKLSKKFDYFSNKIPECLSKTTFYKKVSKAIKNRLQIWNLDKILILGWEGVKI